MDAVNDQHQCMEKFALVAEAHGFSDQVGYTAKD